MYKIINLSLTKKNVPIRFDFVQYATKPGILFVLDDYTPAPGSTASLYIEKPSGEKIYNACSWLDQTQILYEPTTQSFAEEGLNTCQLQIVEPDGTGVSFLIHACVERNIIDASAIESQSEFTALEEALQTVSSYDGRIQTNTENIATNTADITALDGRLTTDEANVLANTTKINNATTTETFTITPITNVVLGGGKGDQRNKVVCTSGTLTNRTGADITGSTDVLASGFPRPAANVKGFGFLSGTSYGVIRLQITTSGTLTLDWGGSLPNGNTVVFNFSYIAS